MKLIQINFMNNNMQGGFNYNRDPRQQVHYISEYDNNGYLNPNVPNILAKSNQTNATQFNRDSYHINANDRSNYQALNKMSNVGLTSRVKSQSSRLISSQVKNEQIMKGESRVNYVPYEKKIVQYENRTYTQKVPIKRKVVQYKEERVIQTIPKQIIKQDYYAVETKTHYVKEIVPEKKIEMVPVQRKVKRYEYVPVQRQIIHYPENLDSEFAKGQSRVILQNQGVHVNSDAEFKPIAGNLLYNYSNRPESRFNPIGYYDQGQSRVFSNKPTAFNTHNYQMEGSRFNNDYGIERHHSSKKIHDIRILNSRFQEGQRQMRGPPEYQQRQQVIHTGNMKRPFELLQKSNVRVLDSPHQLVNERNFNREGWYQQQQRYQQNYE